jgi:predicted kinase
MLLRWYLVYRALVRAKVAAIRAGQEPGHDSIARRDCDDHIRLAEQFAHPRPVTLWITHGLSGSGKTTISSAYANHQGAIRLRSDVERKRLLRLATKTQTGNTQRDQIYSSEATEQTYNRLLHLADKILRSGFSVVVDATFLKQAHRAAFQSLARRLNITWGILDCEQSIDVLQDRLAARQAAGTDASDADLGVLEHQIATQEPLTPLEHQSVVTNLSETPGRINR